MLRIRIFLWLLILAASKISQAQYHSLLHKSYADRRSELKTFYTDEIINESKNEKLSQQKVNQIRELAIKENDRDLELEAALMHFHIDMAFKRRQSKLILKSLDSLKVIAEEEHLNWLKCRVESVGAIHCFADGYNYEQAFNYLEQLKLSLQDISKEEFPEKQICYSQIGYYYYQFHDWQTAIENLKLGLQEKPNSIIDQYQMLCCNNIGSAYEQLKQYDSSIFYYKMALKYVMKDKPIDLVWTGIIQGNIGNCLYQQKHFNEAIPLLREAIDSSLKYDCMGIVSDMYMTLGRIALDENKISDANIFLDSSRYYASDVLEYFRLEKLYPVLARLAQKQGNTLLMSQYLDSALTVKDSMARKLSALYILKGKQKATMLKEQKLEDDKRLKTTQRNFLIAFIILLMSGAIYIFNLQQKKFKQKRLIDEIRLQQRDRELEIASEQLNEFAKTITEKNRMVEELEKKLGASPDIELISQLRASTILTDNEWERFRKLFEQVHAGYTIRLKEKLPDLTQAETRFMVLAKLKFSNKEMANALNISSQAVRTTWYRLRKKINLPEEGSLEELVDNI